MTELLLARHGETSWNTEGRYQGHLDIDLNDTGRQQAQQLAALVAAQHEREPIDALISSDLARAFNTAQPIAATLGLHIETDPRLRERHLGALQGHTREDNARLNAEAHARMLEAHFPLPGGGESQQQFHDRVHDALHELARRHAGQRVLIVTHGGVLAMAWRIAMRVPVDAPRAVPILNASLNALDFDGTQLAIRYWGETGHLDRVLDEAARI
jgi:2,3-bisphosphoglycerate-dependent phosphoglycerate mutase